MLKGVFGGIWGSFLGIGEGSDAMVSGGSGLHCAEALLDSIGKGESKGGGWNGFFFLRGIDVLLL